MGAFGMLGVSPLAPSLVEGFRLSRLDVAFIVPSVYPGGLLLAFAAGIGAHGWVGMYFIASAEAGGARQSGLLSGVSFAAIVVGLLMGAPLFGSVPEASDSYGAAGPPSRPCPSWWPPRWPFWAGRSIANAYGRETRPEQIFVGAWSSEIPLWTAQNGRAVFTQ